MRPCRKRYPPSRIPETHSTGPPAPLPASAAARHHRTGDSRTRTPSPRIPCHGHPAPQAAGPRSARHQDSKTTTPPDQHHRPQPRATPDAATATPPPPPPPHHYGTSRTAGRTAGHQHTNTIAKQSCASRGDGMGRAPAVLDARCCRSRDGFDVDIAKRTGRQPSLASDASFAAQPIGNAREHRFPCIRLRAPRCRIGTKPAPLPPVHYPPQNPGFFALLRKFQGTRARGTDFGATWFRRGFGRSDLGPRIRGLSGAGKAARGNSGGFFVETRAKVGLLWRGHLGFRRSTRRWCRSGGQKRRNGP